MARLMTRRMLLVLGAIGVCGLVFGIDVVSAGEKAEGESRRPNVLYIMTDQQHADMMSCAGNRYLKTPAMDSLAATGVRFERAYASNPVCLPSRLTMMTGRMPGHFGVYTNGDGRKPVPEKSLRESLGWIFRHAGYETVFGGKTHWPRKMTPESIGLGTLTRDQRDGLAEVCARFLRQEHEKPFLLVASFVNPHDICYMAIDDHARDRGKQPLYARNRVERERLAAALKLPAGVSREDFFRQHCPPLPDNHEVPAGEPEAITDYLTGSFKKHARDNWSAETWRLHRWAYCRLTEMVDAQIAVVLSALRDAGLEENTLVVFSSDHGDMDGSHRLEHKMVLYEESCRVPLIVSYKGVTKPGLVDRTHLVSAGLDLIPTLCDYAGISRPVSLPGRSVRELAEGRRPLASRDQLVVESSLGHMLCTGRYKYVAHHKGARREQLIDLETDPGEMRNLAEDDSHKAVLDDHRRRLDKWLKQQEPISGQGKTPGK